MVRIAIEGEREGTGDTRGQDGPKRFARRWISGEEDPGHRLFGVYAGYQQRLSAFLYIFCFGRIAVPCERGIVEPFFGPLSFRPIFETGIVDRNLFPCSVVFCVETDMVRKDLAPAG